MHFGLEVLDTSGEQENWIRLEHPELGGPWWDVGAVEPQELAWKAAGDVPLTFRILWAPKDKRFKLGHSMPFQAGGDAVPVVGVIVEQEQAPPRPAAPTPASSPPPIPPVVTRAVPPPRAVAVQAPLPAPPVQQARHNGSNGRQGPKQPAYQHRPPKVPMEFTPPPNASEALITFTYLHQMAQQSADRSLMMMMSMHETAVANERTRSREVLESMKLHYQTLDAGQRQLQAALLAASKGSEMSPQVSQTLVAQTTAIAQLANKLEEIDQASSDDYEAQMIKLSENPNNLERAMAGIQGIVGTLANSPLGDKLADLLKQRQEDATRPPPVSVAHEVERRDPPQPQPHFEEGPPLDDVAEYGDDYPDAPPPQ